MRYIRRYRRFSYYNARIIKRMISFVILVPLVMYVLSFMDRIIMPSLELSAEYETSQWVNRCIDQAVMSANEDRFGDNQFVYVQRNENGDIFSIDTDVHKVNQYAVQISSFINKALSSNNREKIPVPIGSLTGKGILAANGGNIYIKVLPKGKVKVNPDTEFTSAGINQTIHQVYMDVDVDIKIVYPLLNKNSSITRRVLVAETVIVGDVPAYLLN